MTLDANDLNNVDPNVKRLLEAMDAGIDELKATLLTDLLARIEALESRSVPAQAIPSRYTMEYPGGIVASFVREVD